MIVDPFFYIIFKGYSNKNIFNFMGILDKLYNTKYLVFLDIEFQIIQAKMHDPYILELGIIIFEQGIELPVLIDHVNFPLLTNENIRLLGSKYCTVTEKTEVEIKKLESELSINVSNFESIKNNQGLIEFIPDRKIRKLLKDVISTNNMTLITNPIKIQKIVDQMYFNFFKMRLRGKSKDKYSNIFDQIINLYKNDELVQRRNINPFNYLNTLKPYFNNMTLVHKEGMDIIALNNDLRKYNVKIEKKIYHKDIAEYNKIFISKYNTAKLYESYVYLKKDYENEFNKQGKLKQFEDDLNKRIKEKMPIIKPHNPLSDTYFTIFIFIIIETFYKV